MSASSAAATTAADNGSISNNNHNIDGGKEAVAETRDVAILPAVDADAAKAEASAFLPASSRASGMELTRHVLGYRQLFAPFLAPVIAGLVACLGVAHSTAYAYVAPGSAHAVLARLLFPLVSSLAGVLGTGVAGIVMYAIYADVRHGVGAEASLADASLFSFWRELGRAVRDALTHRAGPGHGREWKYGAMAACWTVVGLVQLLLAVGSGEASYASDTTAFHSAGAIPSTSVGGPLSWKRGNALVALANRRDPTFNLTMNDVLSIGESLAVTTSVEKEGNGLYFVDGICNFALPGNTPRFGSARCYTRRGMTGGKVIVWCDRDAQVIRDYFHTIRADASSTLFDLDARYTCGVMVRQTSGLNEVLRNGRLQVDQLATGTLTQDGDGDGVGETLRALANMTGVASTAFTGCQAIIRDGALGQPAQVSNCMVAMLQQYARGLDAMLFSATDPADPTASLRWYGVGQLSVAVGTILLLLLLLQIAAILAGFVLFMRHTSIGAKVQVAGFHGRLPSAILHGVEARAAEDAGRTRDLTDVTLRGRYRLGESREQPGRLVFGPLDRVQPAAADRRYDA